VYGDFSRGHEPDLARGRRYRRVLLQQGRPVLDSDVAARVDALLAEIRATNLALGCRAGSSDLGFLVTPGRLVTIFARVRDDLQVTTGAPDAWIDFRYRFAERYPALHLAARSGLARIQVPAVQELAAGPLGVRLTLWAEVDVPTTVTVNGISVPLIPTAGGGAAPFTFTATNMTFGPIEIGLAAGEVRLFLLEQFQPVGTTGAFSVAPGSFGLDGLLVNTDGADFPEVAFSASAGFSWQGSPALLPLAGLTKAPSAGDRVVAYLEVWERVVTAIEDPGIGEVALGGTDTSLRSQLVGQVKLADVSAAVPVSGEIGHVAQAFDAVEVSGGELVLTVPAGAATSDPCALPESGGYSGDDNRLYRIEVHDGGSLAQVRFKWSRDNGSDLVAATVSATGDLILAATTTLAAGDIVEVLSSVVDLGDDVGATVAPGVFMPAQRAVGQLGQLIEIPSQAGEDTVRFRLAEVTDSGIPVALDDRYGDLTVAGLKLRRWHGVLHPAGSAGGGAPSGGPYVLEDGITVTLPGLGAYRSGQYWQYQARTGAASPEPWRPAPHGPARWFTPLALLRLPESSPAGTSNDGPWELVAWLDERYDHLCELDADDIGFDGDRVGSGADTVQEALEEIYERLPSPQSWPAVEQISWRNDRPLSLARFLRGLEVIFTEEMHPSTATNSSFVVTLEVPQAHPDPTLISSVVVGGAVSADGRSWTFTPTGITPEQVTEWLNQLDVGALRGRVRLAADVVLDRDGQRPLDGDAIGQVRDDGYETYVDLRLPSGDGNRGGDFHSWFFLVGQAPPVRVEAITPASGSIITAPATVPSIMISFSGLVRFETLTEASVVVSGQIETPGGVMSPLPIQGSIQPYPFEANPQLVSRITFVPDDPAVLRPGQGGVDAPLKRISVTVSGTAGVVDADGRPLDGAGAGGTSDFVAEFTVQG